MRNRQCSNKNYIFIIFYIMQKYIPDDWITDTIRNIQLQLADRTPDIFLHDRLLWEYPAIWIGNNTVTYTSLFDGKYHDNTSHSDHQYARRTRFWTRFGELQQFHKQDDLNWIAIHHRYIIVYMLKHHVDVGNSLWTIYNDIKCLTRILNVMDVNDLYVKYNVLMEALHNHMVEHEQWNRLSDRELGRMIDYEKLQDLRDGLEHQWRDRMAIVGSMKSFKEHSNCILLSLYTLALPERKEALELKIIWDWVDNDGKQDYLYMNNTTKQSWYVFNKYKKKHDKIVIQLSNRLSKLLFESLSIYPRKYLFTYYNNLHKPVSCNTVSTRMNHMFKHNLNKSIGVSSLRSSFVSWLFRTNASTAYIKQCAMNMRTSYYAFMSFYRKIVQSRELRRAVLKQEDDCDIQYNYPSVIEVDNYSPGVKIEPEDDDGTGTYHDIQHVISRNNNINHTIYHDVPPSHHKAYHKEYYQKNKDKIKTYQKQYYKNHRTLIYVKSLLYRLNTGQQRTIYQKTEVKYGVYRGEDMIWKSKYL